MIERANQIFAAIQVWYKVGKRSEANPQLLPLQLLILKN